MTLFLISKTLGITALSFLLAFFLTPVLTRYLFKYKLGKQIRSAEKAPIFNSLHKSKAGTPTMGGILIWGTVFLVSFLFFVLSRFFDGVFSDLNFLSRGQTWLPLGALIFAAIIGLFDDLADIFRFGPNGEGLNMKHRILLYTFVAVVGAYWFYFKLDWDFFHVPFFGDIGVGWWYFLIFVLVIVTTSFSINETDGLDGLAGGVLLFAFGSMAVISFIERKFDLAVFNGAIIGSLLAFLWFNIYPARFFMGDTGAMSLGVVLGTVAMLTNSTVLLPFFVFIPAVESVSVIVQIIYRKIFGRKIFLSSPIHHHFEAKGWPETQITQRFWIISAVMNALGLILFFLDRTL